MIGTNLRELEKYIKNVTAADQVMIWNFSVEHEKLREWRKFWRTMITCSTVQPVNSHGTDFLESVHCQSIHLTSDTRVHQRTLIDRD